MIMAEEEKTLSEVIKDDMNTTFDELMKEMTDANKEVEDGVSKGEEEKGEEEGKEKVGKEEAEEKAETEEKSTSKESESEEGLETADEKKSEEEEGEGSDEKLSFEPGELEPNSVWDEGTQEGFKQLPEKMQEFMLKRDREMTADYTRKTQEIAGIKRALEPVRGKIKEMGIDEGTAVRNLVATHSLLEKEPLIGLQYLMTVYKVPLEDLQSNWQDPDTFTQKLKEGMRLSRVETKLDERETGEQEAQYKANMTEITEFAKDHPYFDAVEPQMKELIRKAFNAGEPRPSLQSLYDEALKTLKASGFGPNGETEKTKSGKDIKKAKKASTHLKSAHKKKDSTPAKPITLHDELSQGWEKSAKKSAEA